jgi:tetratricopeptide (TPR) repeat protein
MSIKSERQLSRAKKLLIKGKIREAESIYLDILLTSPKNKDAKDALRTISNRKEAALPMNKIQLAVSFINSGQIKEAIEIVEPLIKNFPNESLLFNIMGVCNHSCQNYKVAINDFRKAVELNSGYAEAYYNLGVSYGDLGEIESAKKAYKNALRINNNYPTAQNNLGQILFTQGEFKESISYFKWALEFKPDFAEAYYNLGNAYLSLEDLHNAIKLLKKAISVKPDFADAYNNLGIAYLRTGEQELAREFFENAIALVPAYASAHHNLSSVKKYYEKDSQVIQMESLLSNTEISIQDQIYFSFSLAKVYEDLGSHKELFKHLNHANRMRKKQLNYSISDSERHNEMIKLFFNNQSNNKIKILYKDSLSVRPIFIVGMPRSGTSLVEQIVSSHNEVHGAGELKNFNNIIVPIIRDHLSNEDFSLTEDEFRLIRKQYEDELSKFNVNEKIITDKWPLNFRSIGFILSAFPEAKIIHLKRNPTATCWSIYKHYFSHEGNGWAYNLNDLADFYNLYIELMNYWHDLYPGKIYDISYEELTSNQEKETRKLIQYCDLNWDQNCLNFHKNKRDVKTASSLQVRKKMYQGSSDAWRKYADYLKPLNDALSNQ